VVWLGNQEFASSNGVSYPNPVNHMRVCAVMCTEYIYMRPVCSRTAREQGLFDEVGRWSFVDMSTLRYVD
jgi:hypothetical protein